MWALDGWVNGWWMDAWTEEVCLGGGWMNGPWIDVRMNAWLVCICILDGCMDDR